jgi:hypothetical protein
LTHGKQTLLHDSLGIIKKGALDKIEGPCPFSDPGLYRFKIETVDENKVIITELNTDYTYEYPRWTKDGSCVIYDSNKSGKYQIYAYHLEEKTTTRISPDIKRDYRFGNFENLPK